MHTFDGIRHASAAAIEELQRRWPAAVGLDAKHDARLYTTYPHFLATGFTAIDDARLARFGVATWLFAMSVFDHDAIIDDEVSATPRQAALRILPAQFEAYRILAELFPAGAQFWTRLQENLASYAEACVWDARLRQGTASWNDFNEDHGVALAVQRAAISKTVVAGLADLADDHTNVEALVQSIDAYNVAVQYVDDLRDWKHDLSRGIPSLVLRALFDERPQTSDVESNSVWLDRTARRLYYDGHAHRILRSAITHAMRAKACVAGLALPAWQDQLDTLQERAESFLSDIDVLIRANVARLSAPRPPAIELPEATTLPQRIATTALRFVLAQQARGFTEAKHYMRFPRAAGFHVQRDVQMGVVFQRALIADALCDANDWARGALSGVLHAETEFLIEARRRDGCGGWSYFPTLPDLAPDADDLAQVMQVLLRSSRRDLIELHAAESLRVLFDDCAHADGSVETWIIPAAPRSEIQSWQYDSAMNSWGTGPDVEVVANLVFALNAYDADRFAGWLPLASAYIAREQQDDGAWASSWYHGPFYGTYACVRALATSDGHRATIDAALGFLRTRQHDDGGWGLPGQESDALSTALALLALAKGQEHTGDRDDEASAAQAFAYLDSIEARGAWPKVTFIVMPQIGASYASRTITTTYVMKAALAWDLLAQGRGEMEAYIELPVSL